MIDRPSARAMVVPFQALIDIAGDSYIMPARILIASDHVDKSVSDSAHVYRSRMNRTVYACWEFKSWILELRNFSDVCIGVRMDKMVHLRSPRSCASYGETASAYRCVRLSWAGEELTMSCLPSRSSRAA